MHVSAYTALLIAVLVAASSRAQSTLECYGSFQAGLPSPGLEESFPKVGFGGGAGLLINLKNLPLQAGLEMGGLALQRRVADYTLIVEQGTHTSFQNRRRSANNAVLLGHLVLRASPPLDFPVLPYVDGLVGFKNVFTRLHEYERRESRNKRLIHSERLRSGLAWSFGGAAGLHLKLDPSETCMLDVRCAFLWGTPLDFLIWDDSANGLTPDEIQQTLVLRNARTDMVILQVGLLVAILPSKTK